MMSRRIVVFSSGGNLYAIAQRGARDVTPISRALAEIVDLHDDAVDLVAERVAVALPSRSQNANTPSRSSNASMCGFTGKPSAAQPRERLLVRAQPRAALLRAELVA